MKNICFSVAAQFWVFIFLLGLCVMPPPVFAGNTAVKQKGNWIDATPLPLSLQNEYLVPREKGSLFLLTAFEVRSQWIAPISQYRGDLLKIGSLRLDYFLSPGVVFQVKGTLRQKLRFREESNSGAAGQLRTVQDVEDFHVSTIATFLSQRRYRPAIGLRIDTRLPNTNQKRGLGTNTTDIFLALLTTKSFPGMWFFGELGVGILTAPRVLNRQNDVLLYGLGMVMNIRRNLQIAAGVSGMVSTKQKVEIGTENRGIVQIGLHWKFPDFSLEVFPQYGLHERSGTFGVHAGLGWQLNFLKN